MSSPERASSGSSSDVVHRLCQGDGALIAQDVEDQLLDKGEMGGRGRLDHLGPAIGQVCLGSPPIGLTSTSLHPPGLLHAADGMGEPARRKPDFASQFAHPQCPIGCSMQPAQNHVIVMCHPGLVPQLAVQCIEQRLHPTGKPEPRPQFGPAQRIGHGQSLPGIFEPSNTFAVMSQSRSS